jgi:predicted AAA+ superfamily ATPase
MYNRILSLPLAGPHSIFLLGPRGTGKTTWVKEKLPDCLYIDLEGFGIYGPLLAQPSRLESLIPPDFKGWVVIDEVQRVPQLLDEVERLIQERGTRFLLTASSAQSLRKQGINTLLAKVLTYQMHPLTIQEIDTSIQIPQLLKFGLLPEAVANSEATSYLASYIQQGSYEEVLQQGLTRNISGFTRFLERASFSQGSVLNVSELARELSLNRLMVSRYFDLLEDLLLATRITPFTHNVKRKIIAHNKFYFFDTGVYNALRYMGSDNREGEMASAALQTLFLQSARAINDYYSLGYNFYFWQTFAGIEVPFILHGPRGIHAFAITTSPIETTKLTKPLRAFSKDYPEARTYLLYAGKQRDTQGAHTTLSFSDALKELPLLLAIQNPMQLLSRGSNAFFKQLG